MKVMKICGKVLLILVIIVIIILIIDLLFLNFYPSIGDTHNKENQKEYEKLTELYYDKQFHNEKDFEVMTGTPSEESERSEPESRISVQKIDSIDRAGADEMKVTWLGHSSSLVQMGEKNIFIDPVLSERSSPVGFAGPKRFSDIALDAENVPDIDVLFISHDHYDYLDYQTIKDIDSKVSHYVTPLGIDVILKGWGVDESKLHPRDWWDSTTLDGVTYTVIPSQHYTGRNPMKQNATEWGGLYIKTDKHSFYYTGDSGYYEVFSQVYEHFGETDLMLAVKAAKEQGANIATPRIGQTVSYDDISSFTEHWWEEYK